MRIAHLAQELNPAHGGPTTVLLNMVVELARAGLDVEVWTADAFGWRPPEPATLTGTLTLIERPGPYGLFDRSFFRRFRSDLSRIDLLHHHSLWRPYAARFVGECHRLGRPVVHTMHGMMMTYPMQQKSRKKRTYLQLVGARQLRRTSAVQMLNRGETEQSRQAGVNFRYFELPNGVDTSAFSQLPPRGSMRRHDPVLHDRLVIASLGRLHWIKGPDLLLQAFLDLADEDPGIALVMAGPDEGMRPRLEPMLRGRAGADRVRMPGLVRGEARLALLADADLFAQCSLHETMSMSIIEAAYAGLPLLITDRCNCPEIIEAGAGVVVPPTVDGVRGGLRQLLADRARLTDLGRRARRLVEEQLTLSVVIPRLIEHYRNLLGGKQYPWILS